MEEYEQRVKDMKKKLNLVYCIISLVLLLAACTASDEQSEVKPYNLKSTLENEEALQLAIVRLGDKVEIPETFEHHSYELVDVDNYEDDNDKNVWNLYWWLEGGRSLSIDIDELGNLLSYKYRTRDESSLTNHNFEFGKTTADQFLQKVLPNEYTDLVLIDMEGVYDSYENFSVKYVYQYEVYGLPVKNMTAEIGVDMLKGEVADFKGFWPGYTSPDFPRLDVVALDKTTVAEKLLQDQNYVQIYQMDSTVVNNPPNVNLTYTFEDDFFVDAVSGFSSRIKKKNVPLANKAYFVVDEKRADNIIKEFNLLSGDEAVQIMKDNITWDWKKSEYTQATLVEGIVMIEQYYWHILASIPKEKSGSTMERRMECLIDAKDRTIVSYRLSDYPDREKTAKMIDPNQMEEIERSILEKMQLPFHKLSRYDNGDIYDGRHWFYYVRLENKLHVPFNYTYITLEPDMESVTYFHYEWYDNIQFKGAENALTKKEAFDLFDAKSNFTLGYFVDEDTNQANPAYFFQKDVNELYLDAVTGQFRDVDGFISTPELFLYPEFNLVGATEKVRGLEYKAEKIALSGFPVPTEFVVENKEITWEELLQYTAGSYRSLKEILYKHMVMGTIDGYNIDLNKSITRYEGAKFFTNFYDSTRNLDFIRLDETVDDEINRQYEKYVAFCLRYGLMELDDSNQFRGDDPFLSKDLILGIYRILEMRDREEASSLRGSGE